jgi:hypothetical protein
MCFGVRAAAAAARQRLPGEPAAWRGVGCRNNGEGRTPMSTQERGGGASTSDSDGKPDPGPAPVGPAVHGPAQTPAETPKDPGAAPPGPAVDHGGAKR